MIEEQTQLVNIPPGKWSEMPGDKGRVHCWLKMTPGPDGDSRPWMRSEVYLGSLPHLYDDNGQIFIPQMQHLSEAGRMVKAIIEDNCPVEGRFSIEITWR